MGSKKGGTGDVVCCAGTEELVSTLDDGIRDMDCADVLETADDAGLLQRLDTDDVWEASADVECGGCDTLDGLGVACIT